MKHKTIGEKTSLKLIQQGYEMTWIGSPTAKAIIILSPSELYTVRYESFRNLTVNYPLLTRRDGFNTVYSWKEAQRETG